MAGSTSANTDELVRYPFRLGDTGDRPLRRAECSSCPAAATTTTGPGTWSPTPSGTKLYVTVGSATNVDAEGDRREGPRRAAILELNPDGSGMRVFASGLRNPLGLDWAPGTDARSGPW